MRVARSGPPARRQASTFRPRLARTARTMIIAGLARAGPSLASIPACREVDYTVTLIRDSTSSSSSSSRINCQRPPASLCQSGEGDCALSPLPNHGDPRGTLERRIANPCGSGLARSHVGHLGTSECFVSCPRTTRSELQKSARMCCALMEIVPRGRISAYVRLQPKPRPPQARMRPE